MGRRVERVETLFIGHDLLIQNISKCLGPGHLAVATLLGRSTLAID